MRLRSLRLTPVTLERCRPLWGDRSLGSEADVTAMIGTAADLLRRGRARGTLIEDEHGEARFFGLTVFAGPAAVERLLSRSPARIAAHLLQHGAPDVCDRVAIASGNRSHGLQLVVCAQGYAMAGATEEDWGSVMGTLLKDFHDLHRGFRLNRIVGEAFGEEGTNIVVRSRAYPDVRCATAVDVRGMPLPSATFSLTHQQAIAGCSALLPMFTYFPPRVLFTEPEQDVLREAMDGATDTQIAARLGIGLAAVKARLTRAYERVQARVPGVLPVRDAADGARGSQVRHLVLEFVRANPSELTPYARTLVHSHGEHLP